MNVTESNLLNNLTFVQRNAIQRFAEHTPIWMIKENTLNALMRKDVLERYSSKQYWDKASCTLVYWNTGDLSYNHSGTRLTALGLKLANALGYLKTYEVYADELELKVKQHASV